MKGELVQEKYLQAKSKIPPNVEDESYWMFLEGFNYGLLLAQTIYHRTYEQD